MFVCETVGRSIASAVTLSVEETTSTWLPVRVRPFPATNVAAPENCVNVIASVPISSTPFVPVPVVVSTNDWFPFVPP